MSEAYLSERSARSVELQAIVRNMPPAGARVGIRPRGNHCWSIGDGRGHDCDLAVVLSTAAADRDDSITRAAAWQWLLMAEFDSVEVQLLCDLADDHVADLTLTHFEWLKLH